MNAEKMTQKSIDAVRKAQSIAVMQSNSIIDPIHLLSGLLMGVVPSVIYYFTSAKMPIAWVVCLMVSVILFAGAVIFKGRAVAAELQRRFHV